MRKTICIILTLHLFYFSSQCLAQSDVEDRISALLRDLSLEEKIGQMHQVSGSFEGCEQLIRTGKIGSFLNVTGAEATHRLQKIAVEESRFRIPLIFGLDVIHGYKTIFPIPLGEASTWDASLIEQAASVAAKEAAVSGIKWTFAPMVDIARDPRWGRIAEGSGEDTYLGTVMAAARVRGFQGNDTSDPFRIIACPKHYVGYGGAEGGRDYNTVDMSEKTLREVYLPPFEAAVRTGAGTIMSAFNEISGMPASANPFTLTKILRDEWGFDGFVVSDWNSIGELINHGIADDSAKAGQLALQAGVDMDMMGFCYTNHLVESVKSGAIPESWIDEAVRRILRIKFRAGLFERPYVDAVNESGILMNEAHVAIAREVARKSIVLLKNDGKLLPLSKRLKSIAVIGPLADNRKDPLGCWSCEGRSQDVVTVLEGIKAKNQAGNVVYHEGCPIHSQQDIDFSKTIKVVSKADVAVLVIGESADMSGEASCRSSLDLPGRQEDLVKAVVRTGTPTVVVLMNGRPLSIPWIAEHVPAILETWFAGSQCGHAIADVLFGDHNPGGKLPVSFPRAVGQVPIYYNHKNTGRPPSTERFTSKYLDIPNTPLFPFGFGLSYTTFAYRDLELNAREIVISDRLEISATIENTGALAGEEVVQLYVRDVVGSMTRPVKELKGFQRIALEPGESKKMTFTLSPEELKFYNTRMEHVIEPGLFQVWIGPNSAEGLVGEFYITQ